MKRNRGRYQRHDKKAVKRQYMSYEDVPLQDYRDTDPVPDHLTRRFIKGFIIVILSVILVLIVTNIEKFTPESISHWFEYDLLGRSEGDGYPTKFIGTTVNSGNFDVMNGIPVYCSDTSIVVLNSNAGRYQESRHSFANPILKTNSNYSIVCNANANGFSVIDRNNIVQSGTAENKIFSADVSPNGVYAVLTHSDDYLSKLTVYRSDGQVKYTYSFADYYVNNVSLNKDGTKAIVSGVSAKNGGLISVIYVLDFTQSNYMQMHDFDDTYIYDLMYLDNGNALAVSDKSAIYININDGEKKQYDYRSETLTCYNFNRTEGLLLSLSDNPDGTDCGIRMLRSDGTWTDGFDTNSKIISVDSYRDKIAVLSSNGTSVYDHDGKQIASSETIQDARKICMVSNDVIYSLGKTRICRSDINYS